MICPISKVHCDDECCTVGSECNISGNDLSDSNQSANYQESDTHEEATNGLSTRLKANNLPSETQDPKQEDWDKIHQEFIDDIQTVYLDKASAQDLVNWLSENYSVPQPKN